MSDILVSIPNSLIHLGPCAHEGQFDRPVSYDEYDGEVEVCESVPHMCRKVGSWQINPYRADVDNEEVWEFICDYCIGVLCDEI